MEISELRLSMMKAKKEAPERAKVLQAILASALLIAKTDKNREVMSEDITQAAKKELKMNKEAKDAGAPYNAVAFDVCGEFLPKMLSEAETKTVVETIVKSLGGPDPKMIGKVMGELSKQYGDTVDKALCSKIMKEMIG